MVYPYMTLQDETEVAHTEVKENGTVIVYFEKPVDNGFKDATCILPEYKWLDIKGYNEKELKELDDFIHNNAHLIMEYAAEGGFENAAAI